jgi:hypothetical protein
MMAEKSGIVEYVDATTARQRTVNTFRGNRYAHNNSTTVDKDVSYLAVSRIKIHFNIILPPMSRSLIIGWGGLDWIDLAQDMDQWRALVTTVMNLWVP